MPVDAAAVVFHAQHDHRGTEGELEVNAPGLCVADGVGDRLLPDAQQLVVNLGRTDSSRSR